MPSVSFSILGVPVAKQRHRGVALQQCRKCGKKTARRMCLCGSQDFTYLTTLESTPAKTRNYESLVAMVAGAAMNKAGVTIISQPLSMVMRFYFMIPVSRARKLQEEQAHTQRPDLDNCIKAIEDGLNKVLFTDDSLVWKIEASKHWSATPRAEVIVDY